MNNTTPISENQVVSFPPIINQQARILILGSMPGVPSLEQQQYYANPRNQFWSIMRELLAMPGELHYEERIDYLQQHGIALWDVIESCERQGSLDTRIKHERVNDIRSLLQTYHGIRLVAFNGSKAFEVYRKRIGFDHKGVGQTVVYQLMPSTSPANTIPLAKKYDKWSELLQYLK